MIVVAVPLAADHAGVETTEFEGGIDVTVRVDASTGGYEHTALHLGHMDLHDGEIMVLHSGRSGYYGLTFVASQEPSRRTAEEVIFRVSRMPMVSLPGEWADEMPIFVVPLGSEDDFLDLLIGGERLIYRIGDDTDTLEVPIPESIGEAVAFFRRQVALHGT